MTFLEEKIELTDESSLTSTKLNVHEFYLQRYSGAS